MKDKSPPWNPLSNYMEPPQLEPDSDFALLQRAAERVFMPRRVKKLEAEAAELNKKLETAVADLKKRDRVSKRESQLRALFRVLKNRYPTRRSNQKFIASNADKTLEHTKTKLKDVCPVDWPNHGMPRTLSEIFMDPKKYPVVYKRLKTLISKA